MTFLKGGVAAVLLLCAAPALAAEEMLELPVNERILAMTYVYCLTGDEAGAADMLAQRIEFAGGRPSDAEGWVRAGYCDELLKAADAAVPRLKRGVTKRLRDAGFDPAVPFSEQEPPDDGGTQASIFKKIGRFLAGLFSGGGGGAGGEATYITYSNSETGESMSYCDRSWGIGKGKFDDAAEPIPFNPERT